MLIFIDTVHFLFFASVFVLAAATSPV